jgi:DNA-binding NtrC family response regulator
LKDGQKRSVMKKILVADQEEILCFLYQEELMEEGYDVVIITRPENLMQVVGREKPDLLLIDVSMDDQGMWDFLQRMQKSGCHLPIILCTTYSDSARFPKTLIDDTVVKSSNLDELKFKIRKVLGARKDHDRISSDTGLVEMKEEKRPEEQMRLFFQE